MPMANAYIDGGSQAAIRYGVYALQRAEVLGKADTGLDIHEKTILRIPYSQPLGQS